MALSIGKLMSGACDVQSSDEQVRLWRRTYDVNDPRADVARKLGDGSAREGKIVITTIIDAAKEWFDTENKEARAKSAAAQLANSRTQGSSTPRKERVLRWNLLNTLQAVLAFTDFKTGECVATYEMIAKRANICRDTVYRHLNQLRDMNLIDWVRRCEPTGNKEGQRTKAAPNAYFFEISRLPSRVQMLIRKILNRRGVKLDSHPSRQGSGRVPNRAQRLASRFGKSLSHATAYIANQKRREAKLADAEFINAEMALMGDIPTSKWAVIRHPADPAAQRAYNTRLGIHSFPDESLKLSLQYPPTEQREKD
jgi:hypothetical protein